jgi:hypothetical protein
MTMLRTPDFDCHPEAPTPGGAEGAQRSRYRRLRDEGYGAGGADSVFVRGCLSGVGCERALLFAAGFPTVRYLRIFSRRLAPSPRIASKSSTLLNGPYDLRIRRIFSAVEGPIPGTCCNSSEVAVLRLTGCAGGFFLANAQMPRVRHRIRGKRIAKDRHAMADV